MTVKSRSSSISVIIPTCDREDKLKKTIKSVLNQTFRPKEIILVNNGKKKLKKNLINNKNIKIRIYNIRPYIGPAIARNKGAKMSTSEFLAFLDDDDTWPKNYLKTFDAYRKKNFSDCYSFKVVGVDGKKKFLYKNPKGKVFLEYLFQRSPGIGCSNIIVRKKIFNEGINFDNSLVPSEDKGFVIDLILKKKKISVINKSHIYYSLSNDDDRLSRVENILNGKVAILKKYYYVMSFYTKIKLMITILKIYLKIFFTKKLEINLWNKKF